MLNGNLGRENCICFVILCFISPYFECTVEEAGATDVIVAEVNNMIVRYYFLAVGCKILAVTKLGKNVFNWSRRMKPGCYSDLVFCKVLLGDFSVFIPEVLGDLDRSAATKFRYWVLESDEIFVRSVICNNQDEDDLKLTEGSILFTQDVVSEDAFGNLGRSETICFSWGLSWVGWWKK